MAVSLVSSSGVQTYAAAGGGAGPISGWPLSAPSARQAGDLLVCVIGSSRAYTSVSTGWTQIASIGSSSSFLAAFYRIADSTTNDNITVILSSNGSLAMGMLALRAPLGFDAASVQSHSENVTTAAGASYALTTTLAGVSAGQLSVCLGGDHNPTSILGNFSDVSGTAWTELSQGGLPGGLNGTPVPGGCMTASCPTTGTPGIPSVTYGDTTDSLNKFIFAAVIKEAAASSGLPGGGLFWTGL